MLYNTIIISRTDNIGDVALTLPLAGILKEKFPQVKIIFIGKGYTQPLIEASVNIDKFENWDEIKKNNLKEQARIFKSWEADAIIHVYPNQEIARVAKEAKIPVRIGTSHRFYHWFTCNKRLHFSRKNSDLHEVLLNIKLLEPFGIKDTYKLENIPFYYGLNKVLPLEKSFENLLDKTRINIILHPKSKGSAREWGLENFLKLTKLLPEKKFKLFITGTSEDKLQMDFFFKGVPNPITDLTGKLSLSQLISFIHAADGMVACSTGPLHIAAALGITTLGIYAPMRPVFPKRWAPIGKKAHYMVMEKKCDACKKQNVCKCITDITPQDVAEKINQLLVKTVNQL